MKALNTNFVSGGVSKVASFGTLPLLSNDATGGLITMKELCSLTRLSRGYFYKLISEQRLPFEIYHFGKAIRFKMSEVLAWIEEHRMKLKVDL